MKNVALITSDFPPRTGGAASYVLHLFSGLPADHVVVLTDLHPDSADFDRQQSFPILRKRFLSRLPIWPRWIFLWWHVFGAVRKYTISSMVIGEVLPTGIPAFFTRKFFDIPYIVITHGMDLAFAKKKRRKFHMAQRILRNAQCVIANSGYTASLLKDFQISEERIRVITPGFSPKTVEGSFFSLEEKYPEMKGKRVVLSVGRLVERKGFDKVLEALVSLVHDFPDICYVMVGSGPDEQRLKAIVAQKGLTRQVIFTGAVNEDERCAWYGRCEFLAMPSRILPDGDVEGFGIVFLEAASFGKPSLGSFSGGVPEAILHNETGILVDPLDTEAIAAAMKSLLADPEKTHHLGDNARHRVQQSFQWKDRSNKLMEIIERIEK